MVKELLVSQAVSKIKSAGHDISDEYTTARCIDFLNSAIYQVGSMLIAGNYPPFVKQIMVSAGDSVPRNYMKSCGTYPIRMTDGAVEFIDNNTTGQIRFRYFALPSNVQFESDKLPFDNEAVNEIAVKVAILIALNENEYDLTQDKVIVDMLQQAVVAAMSYQK